MMINSLRTCLMIAGEVTNMLTREERLDKVVKELRVHSDEVRFKRLQEFKWKQTQLKLKGIGR